MTKKKKLTDDERDNHPFYSDLGIKAWKKRLKELEKIEKELSKRKRRPTTDGEGVQEVADEESRTDES